MSAEKRPPGVMLYFAETRPLLALMSDEERGQISGRVERVLANPISTLSISGTVQPVKGGGGISTAQKAGPGGLTEQEQRLLRIIREAKDPAALLLFAVETALAVADGGEEAKL